MNNATAVMFYPEFVRYTLFQPLVAACKQLETDATRATKLLDHIHALTRIYSDDLHSLSECPSQSPSMAFYQALMRLNEQKGGSAPSNHHETGAVECIAKIFKTLLPHLQSSDAALVTMHGFSHDMSLVNIKESRSKLPDSIYTVSVAEYLRELRGARDCQVIIVSNFNPEIQEIDICIGDSVFSLVACAYSVAGGIEHAFVRCNHNSDVWMYVDAQDHPNKEALTKRTGFSFTLSSYNPFETTLQQQSSMTVEIQGGTVGYRRNFVAVYERNSPMHSIMECVRAGDADRLSGTMKEKIFSPDGTPVQDEFGHTYDSALLEYVHRHDISNPENRKI